MTRIFAIRTGSYSDTSWGPVFSTAEKALAYKEHYGQKNHEGCEVEVHVLDDENDTGLVYPSWLIVFDARGDVVSHTMEHDFVTYEPLIHDREIEVFPTKPGNHWYFLDAKGVREKTALIVRNIIAPDLEHAVKIAHDRRGQYLATH